MSDDQSGDLWERHADWWQDGFTEGADAEYVEQILPLAAHWLAGARRVLDIGCGEGQVARLAVSGGAQVVVGIDPTWAQVEVAATRGGGPTYARAGAGGLPFAAGSFDHAVACLVFEHIRDVDDAIAEVAPRSGAWRSVRLLPQPPAPADTQQRVDRRPGARPARAVLAHRPLPRGGRDDRGGGEGRVHPLHPPAAVALRQRLGGQRDGDPPHGRAGACLPASSPAPRSTPPPTPSRGCSCSSPTRREALARPRGRSRPARSGRRLLSWTPFSMSEPASTTRSPARRSVGSWSRSCWLASR